MTMLDPFEAERLERSRRRAVRLLTVMLGLAGLFCMFVFVSMLAPAPKTFSLGSVNEYPIGQTVQRPIRKLSASAIIQNRPVVSEDPLYITRRANGTWRVLLAWDSESGCIVVPQAANATFVDNCTGHIYDADGYLISSNEGLRLGSFPVEIQNDEVLLRDELLPAER